MDHIVNSRRDERILVVEISNPPVNAMAHAVRAALLKIIGGAESDPEIDGVVLTGVGKIFCGGAEIREFSETPKPPGLGEVVNAIEASRKPVIAAINGAALGGGLEIALACHARLALKSARLALPEVKLGLLPGAGGTQRLPRLIGARRALQLIVSGEQISAEEGLHLGLVDAVFDGDLVLEALSHARDVVARKTPLRRVGSLTKQLDASRFEREAFEADAASLLKRARGMEAPAACIASIRNALDLPLAQGLAEERALFVTLRDGAQSKAMRHLFFAERAATKVQGVASGTSTRSLHEVAVLGAGTMGGGIAMCFANAGFPVTLIDPNREALARGLATIEGNYRASEKRGNITTIQVGTALSLIKASHDMTEVAPADLVIEAVFEEMALKKQIFADLSRLTKPSAILATNTSTLDVDEIAHATDRPQDVLGMHFFSPANVMRLLEIVRGQRTAPDVLMGAISIGKKIGKVPVTVGVCDGFVGNRMLHARGRQVERLLLEGASPRDIDSAATQFGFAMGPCAVGDLAGLDVGWRIRKERGTKAVIADAICELGRFGQKTGKGYFLYEPGSRLPISDPEIEALCMGKALELGVPRRAITLDEIQERLIFPLINEAALILDEGIAERASDIDLIWINGYGFPVWHGGPLFYADQIGLAHVVERLAHYAKRSGDQRLAPASLLMRMIEKGQKFSELGASK